MINKRYIVILALLITSLGFAQSTISGVITDEYNEPLPGVNILVKNTAMGTMSDFNGNFSINATKGTVLNFSMIGMIPQNITVGDQTILNVSLKADVAKLDEVVVIGYGSIAKKDLTGSVSSVKTEILEAAPVANFDQALVGRMAGVNVSSTEGTPGEALKIVIRGGNSITSSNDPLYVINGIPMEEFDPSTINTPDIETFQVLKDASATAIYGSRGANGVVVITTKGGKSDGTTDVTFNFSTAVQQITKTLDVLSPYQYVKHLETQAIARDGYQFLPYEQDSYRNSFINRWIDPELYRDMEGTDWQNQAFKLAPMYKGNVSIRGGNETTKVFFSSGYTDQEGVFITTGFKKWNNNLNINHKISDKLRLWTNAAYTNSKRIGAPLRDGRGSQTLKNIILYRPVSPLITRPGEQADGYIPGENDQEYLNLFDPIKNLENTTRTGKTNSIRVNTTLTYNINSNFTLKTTNAFTANLVKEEIFFGLETSQGSRSANGINGTISRNERTTFSSTNTLAYNKKMGRNRINALIGTEYVDNQYFTSRLSNKNLPTDKFGINNLDIGTLPTISLTDASENKLLSYFARMNYNFSQKYLLTATFRADGSSKFQDGNRWGYFPSFSGAWQIGEEDFMDNVDFVNSLKLRAGWGKTGNNRIGNYSSINQFGIGIWSGYTFGADENYQPGAIQSTIAVPDLRWESTEQTNIGLDFSMSDSRLSGTVDYYKKNTNDLLLWADMSPSTGANAVVQNVGSVSNEGLEFSVKGRIIDTKDFKWDADINISTNKNKILSMNQGQEFILSDAAIDWGEQFHYISQVGSPVGMMYGLQFDGLYQAEDFNYDASNPTNPYILKDGVSTYGNFVGPGHAKYVDQLTVDTNNDGIADAGDGFIDLDDYVTIGNPHPKHYGGFNNNFKYKNFDLGILLQWSYDFDVFNANRANWSFPTHNSSFSRLASVAEAWTPWNTDTEIVSHYSNGVATWPRPGYKMDSRYIEDGSFLRLKTVTLGYQVPMKPSTGFKSLRLTLSGQNLYTWTNYSGFDPEVSVGGNPLTQNLDFSAYPQSRTYSFAVIAKF